MRTHVAPVIIAAVVGGVLIWTVAVIGVLYMIGFIDRPIVGEPVSNTPVDQLPADDAPGEDIPELPRFPDSVRVDYAEEMQGSYSVTEVEYLAEGDMDEIRGFYRSRFRSDGWTVTSSGYNLGEWVFQASAPDGASALVEIEPVGRLIEIELELERPAT